MSRFVAGSRNGFTCRIVESAAAGCAGARRLLVVLRVLVVGPADLEALALPEEIAQIGDRREAAIPQEVDLDEPGMSSTGCMSNCVTTSPLADI